MFDHRRHFLSAIALLVMCAPSAVLAATFRGRSVDGTRFSATVMNEDFGAFTSVEVKFNGHNATVYFPGSAQLHLVLDEEDITDPRHIAARDEKRGVNWEIDVRNLREAVEGRR